MFRNLSLWAMAFAAVLVPAVASADTFFTGRVDTSTALGGTNLPGAKLLNVTGGVSYSNQTTGPGGPVVNTVGVAFVPTFQSGNISGNNTASSANRFVAVFALQGSFEGAFNIDYEGGFGQVRFYDRGAGAGGINVSDPSTWVPGGDFESNIVGVLNLTNRPTGILQGPPGGVATEQVIGFNAAEVNTAGAVSGQVGTSADATVIFDFDASDSRNTYFSFLAGYLVDPDSEAFLVDLVEQIISGANGIAANEADLQTIFNAFLGLDFDPNDDYDPVNALASGDLSTDIQIGGRLIPGSLVGVEIPEPASVMVWGLLGLTGGVAAWRRRRVSK